MPFASWNDEIHIDNDLLSMTADLWVKIHGYSYARSWIDRYKQIKKTIQSLKDYENHWTINME